MGRANLNLLLGEKAQKPLQETQGERSIEGISFTVEDACVSIMNGIDENISTWLTVIFLTGSRRPPGRNSVDMLDLGARSTQVF